MSIKVLHLVIYMLNNDNKIICYCLYVPVILRNVIYLLYMMFNSIIDTAIIPKLIFFNTLATALTPTIHVHV